MKTCGECPRCKKYRQIGSSNVFGYCLLQHFGGIKLDQKECADRRAFRVLREEYRKLKEERDLYKYNPNAW